MSDITADTLLPLLGSAWRQVFSEQGQLEAFLAALAEAENGVELSLDTAIASVSRLTSPLLQRKRWHRLVLRESQLNTASVAAYTYGDAGNYGEGLTYGQLQPLTVYRFELPASLAMSPFAMNARVAPTLCWTCGIDFKIDTAEGYIEFAVNPFNESRIAIRGLYVNDAQVDRELELWLYRPDYDVDLFYRRWGYVLSLLGPSSVNYKEAVNAAWDSLVEGSSLHRLRSFAAAVADVPLAADDEDGQVTDIFNDHGYLFIASTSRLYRFNDNALPMVEVGDRLLPGQELVDTVRVSRLSDGSVPSGLLGVTLDKQLFGSDLFGGLFFANETVATTVTTDADGFTDWRFPVGGWPSDVDWLFDTLQTRGVSADGTLAMLLDQRSNKVGQPSAGNLPATVNPAEFVIANVLRNNAAILQLDVAGFGSNALSLTCLRRLPQMLAAHATMLVELTIPAASDTLDATEVDDTVTTYLAATMPDETFDHSQVTERLTARYIDGTCL